MLLLILVPLPALFFHNLPPFVGSFLDSFLSSFYSISEGHRDKDGNYYVLVTFAFLRLPWSLSIHQPSQSLQDFARVFPPEYPSEEARSRKGITLYQLLRPELVKSNPVPLSSGNLSILNICLIPFINLLLKMHFLHGLAQHLINLKTIGRLQQPLNDYSRYFNSPPFPPVPFHFILL